MTKFSTLATAALASTAAAVVVPRADNPLAGYNFYANPFYTDEVNTQAIPNLPANLQGAAKAAAAAGSFYWLDVAAKVPKISEFAADAQKQGGKQLVPLVVYDLPERDCAALASNGELSLDNGGEEKYKQYIDDIAAQLKKFPDVKFLLVIEPDSLANLITNLGTPKCAKAADAYKSLTVYALKTLNADNVVMYLDAGHAGWLGWPDNLKKSAPFFADIYKQAGSPSSVRGLATNVANYNAWSIKTCPSYTQGSQTCDEKSYVNAFAPLLSAAGFPAHFITDTGRNGVQPTKQQQWGDWCNVIGTGFGVKPTTTTDDPLLDAFVWVKPGGECDGTSNTTAVRYDAHCGYADALKPAPEAGQWFQAYFEQLLTNANPPLA